MNFIEQLEKLDLTGRQARIYLALLQLGSAGAIEIAKTTRYKHPTVYDVLDILKGKRLVTERYEGGRKVFTAEDPETFLQIEEERRHTLDSILPGLKELYLGGTHKTRIHCFEGHEGVQTIHTELLHVKSKRYFYFGSLADQVLQSSREESESFVRERIRRGIWSYSIRDRSKEVDLEIMGPGENLLRKVRYLPKPVSDSVSGLYIYDDKIAIGSALKENYTVIIESRELNILMKTLWDYIWEISEEP